MIFRKRKWGIIIMTAVGMTLAMLRFWPVAISFCIIAGVATGVISVITCKDVNYLLVLLTQFVLVVFVIIATFAFVARKMR